MRAKIHLDVFGNFSKVTVFCLKTDIWEDYLHFKSQILTEKLEKRSENRLLRVSLLLLFSHVEAVLNEVVKDDQYSNKVRKASFLERIKKISSKHNIDLEQTKVSNMKDVRNLLVHFGGKGSDKDNVPFELLTLESLESTEKAIIAWLEEVCQKSSTERITDTESHIKKFAQPLSKDPLDIQEI